MQICWDSNYTWGMVTYVQFQTKQKSSADLLEKQPQPR